MPKIVSPNLNPVQLTGRLSGNVPQGDLALGSALINSGQQVQETGFSKIQQELQVLKQAGDEATRINQSVQLANYSNKFNQAKLQFAKRIDERMSQQFDEDGNPTFDSLTDDIGRIGKDVSQELLGTIQDPDLRAKFSMNFDNAIVNKQINSLSSVRQQKQSYVRDSMSKGVNSLIEQAGADNPSNTKFYIDQIDGLTREAELSGALTPQSAEDLRRTSRNQIVDRQYTNLMSSEPELALETLNSRSPEELGVSDRVRSGLIKKAEAAVQSLEDQRIIQEEQDAYMAKEQTNITASQLQLGLEDGSTDLKDIEDALQNNLISDKQYTSLQKKASKSTSRKINQSKTAREISQTLASGGPAVNFTSSQVGKHYQQRTSLLEQQGQPLNLRQKAALAAPYQVQVKPLQNEIEFSLLRDDAPNVGDTLAAVNFLTEEAPAAVEKMNKDALAVSALANNYLEHTTLSPEDALNRARSQLTELDTEKGQQNKKDFKKISAFQDGINETIKDMTGGWFGKNVDEEAQLSLKALYEDAYIRTGDVDASIKLVKAQTGNLFGESTFNEEKGIINDRETLMFLPPERMFPGVPEDVLKQNFTNSVQPILQENINIEDVKIQSDNLSRLDGQPISYGLYTRNEFGEKVPVTDGNGIAQRWAPDPQKEMAQRREQEIIDLTAKSQSLAQETLATIPKEILEAEGNRINLAEHLPDLIAAGADKSTSFYKLAKSFRPQESRNNRRAYADLFAKSIGENIDVVSTAWAGAFANKVLETKDPQDMMNYGQSKQSPDKGDIAILEDKAGIVAGKDKDGRVKVLSKIKNAMKIGTYSAKSILAFRSAPDVDEIKTKLGGK